MGVIGINSALNSTFVKYIDCDTKLSSICHAEVVQPDSSGFLLASNVIDKKNESTFVLFTKFSSTNQNVWDYMIKQGAVMTTYYKPVAMQYIANSAYVVL